MSAAILLLLAIVAMAAFVMWTFALRKWPGLGGFACSLGVLSSWELPNPPPIVNIAGNNIFLVDVLALSFVVLAVLGFGDMVNRIGPAAWVWAFLGVLIIGSFCFGLFSDNLGKAVNEFRSYIYVHAAFSWAMTLDWNETRSSKIIMRAGLQTGWALVAIAGYHYLLYGFGSTSTFVDPGTGIEQTTRPLVSGQALVLLVASVTTLWKWNQTKDRIFLFSALIFLGVVAASQQRTVWAVAAAIALVTFLCIQIRGKLLFIGLTISGAVVVGVLAQSPANTLIAQLLSAAQDEGTYDARLTSWSALVDQQFGLGTLSTLLGQPMGAGFGRFEGDNRWVEFAPHNWYVTIFLRTGILGLLLLILFIVSAVRRALRRPRALVALAIVIALAVYGWTYSWLWYLCLPWGWAISQISLPTQQRGGELSPEGFAPQGALKSGLR